MLQISSPLHFITFVVSHLEMVSMATTDGQEKSKLVFLHSKFNSILLAKQLVIYLILQKIVPKGVSLFPHKQYACKKLEPLFRTNDKALKMHIVYCCY